MRGSWLYPTPVLVPVPTLALNYLGRSAQVLHLLQNDSAIVLLPVPDARDERLAAQVAAVLAFGSKLAFHRQLDGGDAGVIVPGVRQRAAEQSLRALPERT